MVSARAKELSPYRLDSVNETLWGDRDDEEGERIRLTSKTFAVLPEAIKTQIYEIRKLLGHDPKRPWFIETRDAAHQTGFFSKATRGNVDVAINLL